MQECDECSYFSARRRLWMPQRTRIIMQRFPAIVPQLGGAIRAIR
jgi:hypothetical protein